MMQLNRYKMIRREWVFALFVCCLIPLLGILSTHAQTTKSCPNCGAALTIWEQYDATCTAEGSIVYRCNECNNYVDIVTIPMRNHSWKKQSETAASCLEPAMATYRCRNCSLEKVESIDGSLALGHDYVETVNLPTCNAEGYTLHACTRCDDSYQTDLVPKTDHTYSQQILQEPTCVEIGYCRNICIQCGYYETLELPKTDHQWKSEITPPTHTKQGYTSYTCLHCGAGYGDDYTDCKPYDMVWITVKEATCTEGGERIGECSDGCGHKETVILSPLGHEFGEWSMIREPTPQRVGLEGHSCIHCNYSETRTKMYMSGNEVEEPKTITLGAIVTVGILLLLVLFVMALGLLVVWEVTGKGKKRIKPSSKRNNPKIE